MDNRSQSQAILESLLSGVAITPIHALKWFQCFRLGARIWDLENGKFDGNYYDITHVMVHEKKKKYMSYFMNFKQMQENKKLYAKTQISNQPGQSK